MGRKEPGGVGMLLEIGGIGGGEEGARGGVGVLLEIGGRR